MEQNAEEKLIKMIEEHEDALGIHNYAFENRRVDQRLEVILRHHKNQTTQAMSRAKNVRDDMLTYFKALELIASMTEQAGTHAEKNARLRGMIEMLQKAEDKLREVDFFESTRAWFHEDYFRTDNPTRRFVDRIHELETENEQLKKALIEVPQPNGHETE